jgi:hypothetical protein
MPTEQATPKISRNAVTSLNFATVTFRWDKTCIDGKPNTHQHAQAAEPNRNPNPTISPMPGSSRMAWKVSLMGTIRKQLEMLRTDTNLQESILHCIDCALADRAIWMT